MPPTRLFCTRNSNADISGDQTSAANYVIDIDGTLIPNETIECLRTWPSDDDINEAIRIGYDEARALANYLEINNYCTSNSIQQQISYNETSSNNNTNASEIIDNEDDQDQNSENRVNKRKDHWEGRKRLTAIPITAGIKVYNIIDANVSNVQSLIPNGYLIIYPEKNFALLKLFRRRRLLGNGVKGEDKYEREKLKKLRKLDQIVKEYYKLYDAENREKDETNVNEKKKLEKNDRRKFHKVLVCCIEEVSDYGFDHIIVIEERYCGLLFMDCFGRVFDLDSMGLLPKSGKSNERTQDWSGAP
ncbi:hypothetical protein C1646_758171 [Rhizophagus diaphanus]|nr:hypothetical protein C1646_758171 [Rhizophagus diaphanus] [Rhizophagus sp. MUCL 43196]